MHIYEARITGYYYFGSDYSEEDVAITWPCGKLTELTNLNLFELGTAIGEHAIECEVCENVGTTAGRSKASSP